MINPTSCECGTTTTKDANGCSKTTCKSPCAVKCPPNMINPTSCECGTTTTKDTDGCTKTTCKSCAGSCTCPCGTKNNGSCKTSSGSGNTKCSENNNKKRSCEDLTNKQGKKYCTFLP